MRARVLLFALIAWLGWGVTPTRALTKKIKTPLTILISLDGFRHDYPARAKTDIFERFKREGMWAERMIPPFPSQTFPSHATIATGVPVDQHGIINNTFHDRARGVYDSTDDVTWYDVAPLWIRAEAQGIRTFVVHWIASAGSYQHIEASHWQFFNRGVHDEQRIDTIIRWLDLNPKWRPRFVMSYFEGCDHDGHTYGPDAAEVNQCIEQKAQLLDKLIKAVEAHPELAVTLFVTSDHGMTRSLYEINPMLPFRERKVKVEILNTGPLANLYLKDNTPLTQAFDIAKTLPHVDVYTPETLPKQWHYMHPQRTGDLILVAKMGYRFNKGKTELVTPSIAGGHHGHDPQEADMQGIFFAWGAGIKPKKLERIEATEISPLIGGFLGLKGTTHDKACFNKHSHRDVAVRCATAHTHALVDR